MIAGKGHEDYQLVLPVRACRSVTRRTRVPRWRGGRQRDAHDDAVRIADAAGRAIAWCRPGVHRRVHRQSQRAQAICSSRCAANSLTATTISSRWSPQARRRRSYRPRVPARCRSLQVADTLQALGRLGAFNRQLYSGPLVAITGSSGKTTVKNMVHAKKVARRNAGDRRQFQQ